MMRKLIAAAGVITLCSLCGCSGSTAVKQTSAPAQSNGHHTETNYVIGPGDSLRVYVLQNENLSTEVLVRPDGKITTPLVDDMPAVGKTPTQLATDIEAVLTEYIRAPQVSVMVSRPTSTYSQVRVVGQAANPRAVPYRSGMTVLDVLIEVGGLSQFAAGNRAEIIRMDTGGNAQKLRVRLNDLVNKGDISQNVQMYPGDVLLVPESRF